MLNDMFQRQARRLESQLYQRAQDQRTIEVAQRQAQLAMATVRQLESQHQDHMKRYRQTSVALQTLQQSLRDTLQQHTLILDCCEGLQHDVVQLREVLKSKSPEALEKLDFRCSDLPSIELFRGKMAIAEHALKETEQLSPENVGATPTTSCALNSAKSHDMDDQMSNPLHDLSVIADYASKASVSQAMMNSPLSTVRSLHDAMQEAAPNQLLGTLQR